MVRRQVADVTIELTVGDIASQTDLDAVVNAANAQLQIGGGVAGAIHRVAGPGLAEECRPMAPISPGQCVITGGHRLPNRHVLHCLGPVYGFDEPSEVLLADCYHNALRLADEARVSSLGLPAISTGAFGYPMEPAAEVALRTVVTVAAELQTVRLVRFVLASQQVVEVHESALDTVLS